MTRVLLTRCLEESKPLAHFFKAKGIEASVYPLFNTTYFPVPSLTHPQAILVTSKNALRALKGRNDIHHIPLFAVGDETAAFAENLGFYEVKSAGGTSRDLLTLVEKNCPVTEGVLWYLSGKQIKEDLVGALKGRGYQAVRSVVYDIEDPEEIPPSLTAELQQGQITHILFFSPRTAKILVKLLRAMTREEGLPNVTSLCLSQDVAKEIFEIPWKDVWVSPRPEVKSLLGYFNEQ